MVQRRTVRKKKKLSVEEKIKSNQMKILEELARHKTSQMKPAQVGTRPARECPTRFSHLKFVLLLTCHLASLSRASASSLSDFDGATFYKAPLGSRIRIACNASHWSDDSISLVLWFKGNPTGAAGQLQPVYTIDARQKPLSSGQARHLIGDSLKGRARFVFPNATQTSGQQQQQPLVPYLDLAPLEADDQAEYRCRVDYRSRPRENFLVVLFVLVPPSSVEIVDANGRQVEQIYGPLNEGAQLRLVCLSRGGRPPPAVVWKRNGRLIDESYLTLNDFLTLKLANGSHDQKHLHQRQRQGDNDPMQAAGQLSGGNQTAADWLSWPEFNYFRQLLRADQNPARVRHQQLDSSAGLPQLIDLEVDQAATTAVNVLHLSELTRAHLLGSWPEESTSGQLETGPDSSATSQEAAKLECHASNEHYDLHTLIKLFAPASLVEARQQQVEAAGRSSPTSSLTQATERAIWASSLASTTLASAGLTRQHESLPLTTTTKHRQQPPEDAPVQNATQPNWPLLIEQQLIRPHQQLIGAAAASSESAGDTSPKSAKSPPSSQLIRSALIALEANLRPLDVRILQPSRPLVAGQVHEFMCQSSGSRPAARLSWLKDGQRLEPGGQTAAGDGDDHNQPRPYKLSSASGSAGSMMSQSRLTMQLRREDQSARLTCQAENEHFKRVGGGGNERDWRLEDTLTLNVHYSPQVRLELGNKMLSETVREGQDIYFVCQCDSNPAVSEITWLHDERPINETLAGSEPGRATRPIAAASLPAERSAAANLIVSNDSLVLQRLQLEQAGQYTCLASNSEGVGLSNQIELRVLHAPICVTSGGGGLDGAHRPALNQIDNQPALSLGPFRRPAAGRTTSTRVRALKLTCQMLVPNGDPDEQLEVSWWSNGTGGERRLLARQTGRELKLIDVRQSDLLGWPGQSLEQVAAAKWPAEAGARRATPNRIRAERRVRLAVARLELNWTSGADWKLAAGEHVFCLARNSMGDQRRSCHYAIEPEAADEIQRDPEWNSNGSQKPAGHHLACLALNVTASSAWIGCDSRGAHLVAGGQLDGTNQVDENNDRLRAAADGDERDKGERTSGPANKSQIGHTELAFQFNVLVFSLAQSQTKYEVNKQLEANLSSGRLSEPLFAVANLRANADYLLEIEDQSGRISSPDTEHTDYKAPPAATTTTTATTTTISLRTGAGEERRGAEAHYEPTARPKPSIRQVTEPHPADLLVSALISTRSVAGPGDRLGRPSMQQRRAESMWSSLLGQLVGGPRSESPAWRADGRPSGHLASAWPPQGDWASPLALSILSLMLLLVVLVGLTAIRKSRLWSGRPISAAEPYEGAKLGDHLKRAASNNDDEQEDDASDGTRKRSRSSSAVSSSSSPPTGADKRNRLALEMVPLTGAERADCGLAVALTGARRTLVQNNHYSTLDSHAQAQHPLGAFEQPPASLNFLKSSSIATLRRSGPRQPVATIQRLGPIAPATNTVTRSRSSLGFGAESPLLLLAQTKGAAPSPLALGQRLIQSRGARRASLELADSLNGDGRQSAEWLISDANLGLATTSQTEATTALAGCTLAAPSDAHHPNHNPNHDQADFQQPPYMEMVNKPSRAELTAGLEVGLESQGDFYALGSTRLVSELSPSSGCCADEPNDSLHVCQCQATMRRDLIVCCPPEHQQVAAGQQQRAGFIELVPSPSGGQFPFGARYAHQLDLQAYELQMAAPLIVRSTSNQPAHHHLDKQCHQPLFNQSLNSSSVGSPSTNNQLASSPFGSLTNTTPPNSHTESSCPSNSMLMTTGRPDDSTLNKTNRRLTSILKNHCNHSASYSDAPFQSSNRHQATKVPRSSD